MQCSCRNCICLQAYIPLLIRYSNMLEKLCINKFLLLIHIIFIKTITNHILFGTDELNQLIIIIHAIVLMSIMSSSRKRTLGLFVRKLTKITLHYRFIIRARDNGGHHGHVPPTLTPTPQIKGHIWSSGH